MKNNTEFVIPGGQGGDRMFTEDGFNKALILYNHNKKNKDA